MLDPAADSMSYLFYAAFADVPVSWLRWCWQVYLERNAHGNASGKIVPAEEEFFDDIGMTDLEGAKDSNRAFWKTCRHYGSPWERLIRPIVDLSEGLDCPDAPKIIIATNRYDPLHNEGQALIEKLQQVSANITCVEHPCSHAGNTMMDAYTSGELVRAWGDALFRGARFEV